MSVYYLLESGVPIFRFENNTKRCLTGTVATSYAPYYSFTKISICTIIIVFGWQLLGTFKVCAAAFWTFPHLVKRFWCVVWIFFEDVADAPPWIASWSAH